MRSSELCCRQLKFPLSSTETHKNISSAAAKIFPQAPLKYFYHEKKNLYVFNLDLFFSSVSKSDECRHRRWKIKGGDERG